VLRVQPCTPGLGHTPQLGTGPPGAESRLPGWGGGFCQQPAGIDRQTEGVIHVSGCGRRAKTREMLDVRMPAGLRGGSCWDLRLPAMFPLAKPVLPTLPGGPGLAWGQKQLKRRMIGHMH